MIHNYDFRFSNVKALILKITNRCNLSCEYCYENVSKHGQDMSSTKFRQIITLACTSSTNKNLHIIFHGGEPTLLSDLWFTENVEWAMELADSCSKTLSFGIQTNSTALTQKKIELFKKFKIAPGLSLDDPT